MTDKNLKNENTEPMMSGDYKSNLMSVLSPLIFLILVTVLMVVLVHFKGS